MSLLIALACKHKGPRIEHPKIQSASPGEARLFDPLISQPSGLKQSLSSAFINFWVPSSAWASFSSALKWSNSIHSNWSRSIFRYDLLMTQHFTSLFWDKLYLGLQTYFTVSCSSVSSNRTESLRPFPMFAYRWLQLLIAYFYLLCLTP